MFDKNQPIFLKNQENKQKIVEKFIIEQLEVNR